MIKRSRLFFAAIISLSLVLTACGNGAKVKEALAKGDESFAAQKYDEALTAYKEAQALDAKSEVAKSAIEKTTKTIDVEKNIKTATEAYKKQEFDEAITSYESALKIDPNHTDSKAGLAKAQRAKAFKAYAEQVNAPLNDMGTLGGYFEAAKAQSTAGKMDDEEFAFYILQTLLPHTNKVLTTINAVKVDKEFTAIHELLIKMVTKSVQSYTEIVAAVDQGDFSKITSANQHMAEATASERQYVQEIENKAKELDIDLKQP